jgi:methylphosphotriester-DNA--protein-cysteine methyltransferase
MYRDSHSRWSAISQRDPAAHCSFLYGVRTTRIYCRPTCTARLARRANVVYYDTTEQAQRDGFRACQRCKPDDLAFLGQREEIVLKALELLRSKQSDATMTWSMKELAREVGVTPSYLCRVFKKTMGTTVGEYMRQFEMQTSTPTTEPTLQSPDTLEIGVAGHNSDVDLGLQSSTANGPGSTDTRAETPNMTMLPAAGLPTLPDGTYLDSSTWSEEVPDLTFDFEEWVWTEGLDFNDWISFPDTSNNDLVEPC